MHMITISKVAVLAKYQPKSTIKSGHEIMMANLYQYIAKLHLLMILMAGTIMFTSIWPLGQ